MNKATWPDDFRLEYQTAQAEGRPVEYHGDLTRANLARAYLTEANLTWADLRGADLTGADLTRADLTRAYLTGADLRGADLTRADLTGANLYGADIDFSAWPLWCGSKGVIVDRKIAAQLAAHFCILVCDDPDVIAAQQALLPLAKTSHRANNLGLLEEE